MAQAAIAYRKAGNPERFLAKVEDHWRDTRIAEITPEMVRQSARKLYPGASRATWNRQVIVPTQAIINHAAGLGWCAPIKVKRFPIDPKTKTPATLDWCLSFADHASPHLGALCLFMFGTGARIGQACNLTWCDVDMTARTATIRTNKPTPWTRTAHLPPAVFAALANIPSNRKPDDPVFGYAGAGSVKQPWAAVIDRAGIEALTPHCCRHGFATAMLRKGVDVKTVAARGGWRDAATVLRTYAHALEDQTVTDTIFRTEPAQGDVQEPVTDGKKRRKSV
jgi:integrase